jgi:hypothetical protein
LRQSLIAAATVSIDAVVSRRSLISLITRAHRLTMARGVPSLAS